MSLLKSKQLDTGIEVSYKLTDYDIYIMSKKEKLMYLLIAAAILFVIGYIFYRSVILSALLCPFALFYPKIRTKELIEKRKNNLNLQFKDMLYSLSSSMSAGKAIESAFKDILKDLTIIYPDSETDILKEVEYIIRKVEMNETIEVALEDFAIRSHLEDVQCFVDVFQICKRTGGNIIDIIRNSSNIISDKIEVKQEIATLLSGKKFEQKVLTVMPVFMILILSASASDYLQPVFDTAIGRVVMTIAIALILVGYFLSRKIMNIKV